MAKAISYMKPDIDPNTRLYIPFNEGTGSIAKDYSQYANHAQLTDVEWSNDGFNGAGKFNGSSSFGNCGNDASLNITDAITIVARIKPNGADERGYIIAKGNPYADTGRINMHWHGTIDTLTIVDGITDHDSNAVFVDNGVCVNCAITINSSHNVRFYRNNISAGIETMTLTSNNDNLYIGNRAGGAVAAILFNGIINFILMRARTENPAQIAADCYEVVCS